MSLMFCDRELDHLWTRIEEAHERSGIGNLVRPTDLYISPEDWWAELGQLARGRSRASRHRSRGDDVEPAAVSYRSRRHASMAQFP